MRYYIVFTLLLIAILSFVYIFRSGWHPVAIVNSHIIWGWEVEREQQAAQRYYSALKAQTAKDQDFKLLALANAIERQIISSGAERLLGKNKSRLVSQKIERYLKDKDLKSAANTLFNLSFNEFTDAVLVPQAEKELIAEKLVQENRDFTSWLTQQKRQARVYLFTNEFTWTGTGLLRRK